MIVLPPGSTASSAASGAGAGGQESGLWQLIIRHRAGSVAAAVSAVRRRNLFISLGILLLLALSLILILISSRRAEKLARLQVQFVAGVSHDFRTPLSVICTAGENLADGVVQDPQRVKGYGALIRTEGRRLSEMVDHVLEFAGLQSGRRLYRFTAVDVAELVDNSVSKCRPLLTQSGFELEKAVAGADLPPIMADMTAMSSALQNLIGNAVKYSGNNRWIRVSADASNDRDREVNISVEDRGLGIKEGDITHIFEPFYRAGDTIGAQIEGAGLGLSIVKEIVESHGGNVTVESRPGLGSIFTLHLPAMTPISDLSQTEPDDCLDSEERKSEDEEAGS